MRQHGFDRCPHFLIAWSNRITFRTTSARKTTCSFFFSLAAFRTRSSAWVTRARYCARCVLCWPSFPLVPGLGSAGSATGRPALFACFAATMPESDFSGSCISGYGSSPSRRGPGCSVSIWPTERAPGSRTRSFCTCQGLRPRRNDWALAISHPFVLPSAQLTASALGKTFFRGSMAGLCTPLPTLRRHPHGCLRTARGRRGSLLLHRSGLPPPTPCRSPGAPTVMLSQLLGALFGPPAAFLNAGRGI